MAFRRTQAAVGRLSTERREGGSVKPLELYFDLVFVLGFTQCAAAIVTGRRLTQAPEGRLRNVLARDSYSYLHLPMVAGIVLGALGLEATLAHVDEALDAEHAFALLGGTAIYLLGHVALRLRNAHTVNRQRLVLAVAFLLLIPVATNVDSLITLVAINVALWAMIGYETSLYGERRYRLRHGLDPEPPPPAAIESA